MAARRPRLAPAAGRLDGRRRPRPPYVTIAPPPPRFERAPPPRHGYVWAPGYWEWRGNRHEWIGGGWVAERPGYAYRPAGWVRQGHQWVLEQGQWTPQGRPRGPDYGRPEHGRPGGYDGPSEHGGRDERGPPRRY